MIRKSLLQLLELAQRAFVVEVEERVEARLAQLVKPRARACIRRFHVCCRRIRRRAWLCRYALRLPARDAVERQRDDHEQHEPVQPDQSL